jgi:hypothetical protein
MHNVPASALDLKMHFLRTSTGDGVVNGTGPDAGNTPGKDRSSRRHRIHSTLLDRWIRHAGQRLESQEKSDLNSLDPRIHCIER